MPEIPRSTIFAFIETFEANDEQYGQFAPAKVQDGVKIEGSAWTETVKLTHSAWDAHVRGEVGLGVVPIFKEQYVRWTAIDVDEYNAKDKLNNILHVIQEYTLPFIPFRSKSGGLHLYTFYSEVDGPVKAEDARNICKEFLSVFGLPTKTEIFPKQTVLKESQKGNWINLPYFNGDETTRYLLTFDKERLPMADAMTYIQRNKYTLKQVRSIFAGLPMADGPPCLQNIFMGSTIVGPNDGRNNYLFSLSRYWKTKDINELHNQINLANGRLPAPLEQREVDATANSAEKTNATYKCHDVPLKAICNNALCRTREFGIDHVDISNFSFGKLTKYDSDPPYYVWEIDGQKMTFFSERALRDQKEFGYQSMRYLRKAPRMLKDSAWIRILNTAFESMEIIKIEKENDFSLNSLLMRYTVSFMETNSVANTMDQVNMGCVFKDLDKQRYLFKTEEYYRFVRRTKGFTAFDVNEMALKLTMLGGKAIRVSYNNTQFRCWELPMSALASYLEAGIAPVDFLERAEDEEFGDY